MSVRRLAVGEGLGILCQGCHRTRILTRDELIRLTGPDADLATLHTRLKCSACGGLAGDIWLTWPQVFR